MTAAAGLPRIDVVTTGSPVGLRADQLVALGLRHNPRRAHLWVSQVLGKHIGVHPDVALGCGLLLGGLVRCRLAGEPVPAGWTAAARAAVTGDDPSALVRAVDVPPLPAGASTLAAIDGAGGPVVLGFAETATALGHAVADALGSRFVLHSTRRASVEVPTVASFEEGHSHATTHLLTPSPARRLAGSDPLVLVDDELSTGRTALRTVEALHALHPQRQHYVVAALIDLRGGADRAAFLEGADRLGVRIDVVALVDAAADLPADLPARAAAHLASAHHDATALIEPEHPRPVRFPLLLADIAAPWPDGLRHGGRYGMSGGSRPALQHAAARLAELADGALPSSARRVLVVGTEELMFTPLLVAAELARGDGVRDVRFQSTTRSPVHAETGEPRYPVRRRIRFAAAPDGSGAPDEPSRFLYNADWVLPDGTAVEADAIVLVTDDAPADAVRAVAALSVPFVVLRLPAELPLPPVLRGPDFGSYAADEVGWLLTDLSHAEIEGTVSERERRVQSGAEHYAESLPVEYQPSPAYLELFDAMLASTADRLATAVGVLTELVIAERGTDLTLVSLARAGTPVGVLMRRWAARRGLQLPHYAVSIVRDRGIDPVALDHLTRHHDPASVVFVDGWTGKGAITLELAEALQQHASAGGATLDPTIAVLADPGRCTPLFGTRDDFLIASACLNSTVSGLVSRTVLNPRLTSVEQFHGAKCYRELADADSSGAFVDAVSDRFDAVADAVPAALQQVRAADRTPTFSGMAAVERVRQEWDLPSVNLVKPGVGETTRVLLRRVPWRVLVREPDAADHAHIRVLAADRGVPVVHVPDLPYACMGLIRPIGGDG